MSLIHCLNKIFLSKPHCPSSLRPAAGSPGARRLVLLVSLSLMPVMPALAVKPVPPAAPSALSATAVASSQINLNWQDNSGNESGFYVQRGPTSTGPWSLIAAVGVNVTSYSSTGLTGGTTYYYRVCAYNSRGSSAYAGPASATTPSGGDTTPPSVSLTSPASGGTVSGTITLSATASDNVGVARVDFYRDGTVLVGSDTASPFSLLFDTTTLANGSHTFLAKAYDAAGNVGTSATITVTVSNTTADTTPPSVSLASPANGSTVSGTITLSATASDNVSVARVDFYRDGTVLLGSDTASPYSLLFDTTTVANGSHTFLAMAYDVAGNVGTSATVTVTVGNTTPDTTPPSVSLTAPTGGSTVSGSIALSAAASDNVGVARVDFYRDSTVLVGSDTASPYSLLFDTTTVASGSHSFLAMAYDAAGNVGTSATVSVLVNNCTYSLSPTAASFTAAGGTGSLNVTATAGCVWVATSGATWITIVSGGSGTGSGTVNYSVAQNTTTSTRSGSMTIAGQTFTVSQAAGTDTTPPSVTLTAPTAGSTVSGTITLAASASDNVGVSKVEFYCDGTTLVGTALTAPYSVSANTTTLPDGSHSFCAKAYDAAGNSTNSASSTVTVSNSTATPGQLQWVRDMAAGFAILPAGLAVDHLNNQVVVGAFNSTADFGGGSLASAGALDGFIAKYSAQGGFLWSKAFGNHGDDRVYAVAVDSQNNIIVTGYFQYTVDFGGVVLTANDPYQVGQADMFVAKYNVSGNLVWAKQYGGPSYDVGKAVAVDGSDNVVLAANFYGTVSFGGVSLSSSARGGSSIALVKLSAATGATLWAKQYGSSSISDMPNGVAVDGSGDVLVTGSSNGTSDLGGGLTAGGAFVAKYSGTDGSWKWARALGGGAGNGVTVDFSTGNVLVAGSSPGTLDFGGGAVSGGFFVAAYDRLGNYLWAYANGVAGDDAMCVAVDGNGNLAITGQSQTALNFGGTWMFGSGWYVANFAVSGNTAPVYRWARRAKNASYGYGAQYDSSGHVLVAGAFQGTLDFGGASATARVNQDGFLVQYSQ